MKKLIIFIIAKCIVMTPLIAQSPQAFKYQAVVRDNAGEILQNQTIGVRITIHYQSAVGEIAYQETFIQTTNEFGLLNLEIGTGTPTISTFENISWGGSSKYLELEIDPNGGTVYTSIGNSELLSVPFALYSDRTWNAPWERSGNKIYYNDGNVGIGTSDPIFNLDVRSEEANGGAIDVGNSDLSHRLLLFSGGEDNPNPYLLWSNGDSLRFGTDEGGFTERMRITSNGNVGIGTSNPSNTLHVAGDMRLDESSPYLYFYNGDSQLAFIGFWTPTSDLNIFNKITSGSLKFGTDSFERMRITSDGNVGIGTTGPSYKLDVAGKIRAQNGFITQVTNNAGILISNSEYNGLKVTYADDDGVYSHTNNGYGFNTPNATYSNGGYYPVKSGTFAKNNSSASLEPGDLVCISGGYEENVLGEEGVPVVNITNANGKNSKTIFGVVESQVYIREKTAELEDGETEVQKSFRFGDEIVKSGDYLSVIVFGITDVKVNEMENIEAGAKLTVSEIDGTARQVRNSDNWTVGILGKALEDSNGKEKIKVFVNCK